MATKTTGAAKAAKTPTNQTASLGALLAKQNPKPAAKKKPQGKSASAVRNAVGIIDPGINDEARKGAEQPGRETPKRKFNAKPVKRPNGEDYFPRRLIGSQSDVDVMRACRTRDIRPLLYGYPGCGKTALIEAAFGDDLVSVAGHADCEVADFIGTWIPEAGGGYRWVDGPLPIAMREGRPLFVDDATLIAPGVIARLYPAMDGRRQISVREHKGEIVKAEDGFFVIAAHNPGVPGAVLSEALASRFALHLSVESDLQMAIMMGVDRKAVTIAAQLRKSREDGDGYGWAPEMRELLDYQRISEVLGEECALANMISAAPEEARDEVISIIKIWHRNIKSLALRGQNPAVLKAKK